MIKFPFMHVGLHYKMYWLLLKEITLNVCTQIFTLRDVYKSTSRSHSNSTVATQKNPNDVRRIFTYKKLVAIKYLKIIIYDYND